jgi:hypothetical protein
MPRVAACVRVWHPRASVTDAEIAALFIP